MLRLIVWCLIAFFVYRIVQLTARIISGGRSRPTQGDPFTTGKTAGSPRTEFRDIQDAEFEDISPEQKDEGKKSTPPK
jgi:hypothetical protein